MPETHPVVVNVGFAETFRRSGSAGVARKRWFYAACRAGRFATMNDPGAAQARQMRHETTSRRSIFFLFFPPPRFDFFANCIELRPELKTHADVTFHQRRSQHGRVHDAHVRRAVILSFLLGRSGRTHEDDATQNVS